MKSYRWGFRFLLRKFRERQISAKGSMERSSGKAGSKYL